MWFLTVFNNSQSVKYSAVRLIKDVALIRKRILSVSTATNACYPQSTLASTLEKCNRAYVQRISCGFHSSSNMRDKVEQCPRNNQGPRRPLKLMDFKRIIFPNPFKSFKNKLFAFLIRGYYDQTFSIKSFLDGAEQAIHAVSSIISLGKFDDLNGLVAQQAVDEIRRNYKELNFQQRKCIAVNPKDLIMRFVYEIGMIFDDQSERRFVEITAVVHGVHGISEIDPSEGTVVNHLERMRDSPDSYYFCNYSFIREYTKGVEDSWTINRLNHFTAQEVSDPPTNN